ncbi:MAG: hypothetical protein ACLSUV_01695 [Bacilli bacterium]
MYSSSYYINKNFQSSINLELDLNNESKIDEYIPTTDICDVLKIYIKSILGINSERSTTLVGPYGKGKSFLLLVLSYILGKNKNSNTWINLVDKIRKVDLELYEMICELKKKNISLMTIIINSNYDNITQSFQLALNDSLKREKLEGLIPETAYNICLNLIEKWKKDEKIEKDLLVKCLEINKTKLKDLINELKAYSPSAYKQFEKLYNCMNIGLEFNPLVNNDIVKIYSDINAELIKKGYSGMFIIFDEFSKFIESNSKNLMKDLKIVQDMAELCSRSNVKQQINLCCVTHKSISLYYSNEKKNNGMNSFKTVEGRFKEIKFNRSLEENYQIISYAIKKKDSTNSCAIEFIDSNKAFYEQIKTIPAFNKGKIDDDLFVGCFPLNPLTVYILIQLSEYVAQNERTLFTFLSDSDENSFNSFIFNNSSGLFNVDKIYDYFNNLLQKEETNHIRNIWYRAESILAKIEDNTERKIIKVLALILMINDFDRLPPSDELISLSLNIDVDQTKEIILCLLEKHYLRKNILNNLLSFALSNSKHIDDSIDYLSKTKFKTIRISDFAELVNERNYIIPRRYNEKNKITRFFRIVFMEEKELSELKNFDFIIEDKYCDGLIIYLIRKNMSEEAIQEKIRNINDPKVIIKYPSDFITDNLDKLLLRYACLLEIKNKKGIDEISSHEIDLLLEETEIDARDLITKYFDINAKYFSCLNISVSFNELLSITLDQIYSIPLIFNNELINKKNVTAQYQKAINHVIDYLIDKSEEFIYSHTSPETSIKNAVIDYNDTNQNFRTIIEDIKDKISNSGSEKFVISEYMKKLMLPPYGIRLGILPIILAKAISELSDNVILYYQGKEIDLDSNNIVKSVLNEKYNIGFSKSSNEQKIYLEKLLKLFNVTSVKNFRRDTILLSNAIKKFFIGQPQIMRSISLKNNFLNLDSSIIEYKSLFLSFNINPYESIFEQPKKIFKTKSYKELYKFIDNIKESIDNNLYAYKDSIVQKIKERLCINSRSSLKMELNKIIKNYEKEGYRFVLSENDKKILNTIQEDLSYDDIESINNICKSCVHLFIEDWDNDYSNKVYDILTKFINNIRCSNQIKDDPLSIYENTLEESPMGSLLKNNLESILDEFSDSVSTSEKISILSEFIKKML